MEVFFADFFKLQLSDKKIIQNFVLKLALNSSMKNLLSSFFWSINMRRQQAAQKKQQRKITHVLPNVIMHATLLFVIMTFAPLHDLVSETEII